MTDKHSDYVVVSQEASSDLQEADRTSKPMELEFEDFGPFDESGLSRSARSRLPAPPMLALSFLAMFSRFEYALKVTSFRQRGNGEAKADWPEFAKAVGSIFDRNGSTAIEKAFILMKTRLSS